MAKRKSVRKGAKKRAASKRVAKRKPAKKTVARKKVARRKPASKRAVGASRQAAAPKPRIGAITHTELASSDPAATKSWCEEVLGWKFGESMPTPSGPYHMWRTGDGSGGGIRSNNPPELPGSIPYCEVANIHATFSSALSAGAMEMMGPMELPGDSGWIAIVAAPGGVAMGFWSKK